MDRLHSVNFQFFLKFFNFSFSSRPTLHQNVHQNTHNKHTAITAQEIQNSVLHKSLYLLALVNSRAASHTKGTMLFPYRACNSLTKCHSLSQDVYYKTHGAKDVCRYVCGLWRAELAFLKETLVFPDVSERVQEMKNFTLYTLMSLSNLHCLHSIVQCIIVYE